jgi:hypothetical protein
MGPIILARPLALQLPPHLLKPGDLLPLPGFLLLSQPLLGLPPLLGLFLAPPFLLLLDLEMLLTGLLPFLMELGVGKGEPCEALFLPV